MLLFVFTSVSVIKRHFTVPRAEGVSLRSPVRVERTQAKVVSS